jgi:hypothetical protein
VHPSLVDKTEDRVQFAAKSWLSPPLLLVRIHGRIVKAA